MARCATPPLRVLPAAFGPIRLQDPAIGNCAGPRFSFSPFPTEGEKGLVGKRVDSRPVKYKPSLLGIGELSGSGGSVTASHNRFGPYFRNRTIPVNPNTPAQSFRRNNFGETSAAWRGLTPAQQAGWEALGAQIVRTDALGGTYTLNGFMAHAMVNINRLLFGLARVDSAPLYLAPLELTDFTLTAEETPQTLSVAFTPTPIGVGNRLKVYSSGPLSTGVYFVGKGDLKALSYTADNIASPIDVLAAWTSRFGALLAGQKILFEIGVVNASFIEGVRARKFVDVIS